MRVVLLILAVGLLSGCASENGNGMGVGGGGGNQGAIFGVGGSIRL